MVIRLAATSHPWIGETRPALRGWSLHQGALSSRDLVLNYDGESVYPSIFGLRFGTRDLGSRDAAPGLGRGWRVACWERHLSIPGKAPVLFVLDFYLILFMVTLPSTRV
jgi:hypothetical protein